MPKWKAAKLAPDYREKLRAVPRRAWWADEDEPMYRIPPQSMNVYPHHIALEYGLIVEIDGDQA